MNSIRQSTTKCQVELERTFSVYVVECNDLGYFYIGISRNLPRRLEQHRSLKGSSRFVKEHRGMLHLVCEENYRTKAEARKRESELTKSLISQYGAENVAGAGLISLIGRQCQEHSGGVK